MAHFAGIDNAGIVQNVIVAEQEFIDSGLAGEPSSWIQTSYNTYKNTHLLGGTPLRGNFAAVGYRYYKNYDIFMPIPKYRHLLLDLATASWVSRDINNPTDIEPPSPLGYAWDYENNVWAQVDLEYSRQQFASWTKNPTTGQWEAPVPQPDPSYFAWDEINQIWKQSTEGLTISPREPKFMDGRDIRPIVEQHEPKLGDEPTTLDFFQNP